MTQHTEPPYRPLADRMRPHTLAAYTGLFTDLCFTGLGFAAARRGAPIPFP